MSLTLSIRNVAQLDNGAPIELVLHRRGAIIGRSPTCDWSLPDARNFISSRHCEVRFEDGFYWLTDISTNGTILNHEQGRMAEPRCILSGDRFLIGDYEVVATLSGEAAAAHERAAAAAQEALSSNWQGWDPGASAAPPVDDGGWGPPPSPVPAGPASVPVPGFAEGWGPSHRAPDAVGAPPVASPWEQPKAALAGASEWSSAAPDRPSAPSNDDVWGKLSDGYVVDWARGGFGQPDTSNPDPLGLNPQAPAAPSWAPAGPLQQAPAGQHSGQAPAPPVASNWGPPPAPPPPAPPPAIAPTMPPQPANGGSEAQVAGLLQALGLTREQVEASPDELMARTGALVRQLVAGLVLMVEARARAKSQMGAEATSFGFDGNNPLKFARTPEQAIAQLLNPPARGFMDAGPAIEDAYRDLQSHQMATLKAMQGALRATLERFSPTAIKGRVGASGIAKLLPAARDAALWQAYEREFSGVAQGSDEAFMDVFAKEFRTAYDEQSRKR